MTSEILGSRMKNEVSAPPEGVLKARRSEGAIYHQISASGMGLLSELINTKRSSERIDGGFQEDDIAFVKSISRAIER